MVGDIPTPESSLACVRDDVLVRLLLPDPSSMEQRFQAPLRMGDLQWMMGVGGRVRADQDARMRAVRRRAIGVGPLLLEAGVEEARTSIVPTAAGLISMSSADDSAAMGARSGVCRCRAPPGVTSSAMQKSPN